MKGIEIVPQLCRDLCGAKRCRPAEFGARGRLPKGVPVLEPPGQEAFEGQNQTEQPNQLNQPSWISPSQASQRGDECYFGFATTRIQGWWFATLLLNRSLKGRSPSNISTD